MRWSDMPIEERIKQRLKTIVNLKQRNASNYNYAVSGLIRMYKKIGL